MAAPISPSIPALRISSSSCVASICSSKVSVPPSLRVCVQCTYVHDKPCMFLVCAVRVSGQQGT
ncbi:hypothetical protein HaLaN_30271 [Haematococcus lacustris]|uniref:Uncharacterized protein n=1 Tax=Haematococcus lacustris TaxID=44745 RepID=A0A6A0AF32_HAELA|nr:hypothetical protein HaLaN_30271 [Haematococcus lacustris]